MKAHQSAALPLVKRMYNDIFIPEYWQRWPWGLGHWDSSSSEQRTMLCWDGAFSHSSSHPSHCSLVLSTAWYNADAVSPEHAGCFYCRRLCWLQLDHFPGERGALPTGKAVCCVICCLQKQAAAHVGPSLLETETWDIMSTQKIKYEFHEQWKRNNGADRGGLKANFRVHAWQK